MFVETVIATFALGILTGMTYTWLTRVRPVARDLENRRRADMRAHRQRVYRAQTRRQHLGTPYLESTRRKHTAPVPTDLEKLLVDIADPNLEQRIMDNHNGSRRAPTLRSMS